MNPEAAIFPKSPPKSPTAKTNFPKIKQEPAWDLFVDPNSGFSSSPLMEFEAFAAMNQLSPAESEPAGAPQPLECLQGSPIPPFLSKTFDLVDEKSLDSILSWEKGGKSFVVWDPVEFSRQILPRNFKHSNFSSFVRQLNTYGFRKIDTDRWEFANEGFQRGKRHLLKNIQRRKSPHSQQVNYFGLSNEGGRTELESEVDKLKKERSMLMQEVVELQQESRGTIRKMEVVNERIQAAEQRQKQMVSFLAKLFQNPSFFARIQQKKEKEEIGSPRIRRKILKHEAESPEEAQIVKYRPEWRSLPESSSAAELSPIPPDQSPDYLLQNTSGMELSSKSLMPDELAMANGFIRTPDQAGEGAFEGMSVTGSEQVYSGIDSIGRQGDDIWSMGFDATTNPIPCPGLWSNNYEVPELGLMGGFPDIWEQ